MLRLLPLILLAAGLAIAPAARGDVFKLKSGGEVRGELANPDESPREKYIVRPFAGGEVTLEAAVVAQVVHQRPNQVEYEKEKLKLADTVDDQWKMAEWCRENKLEVDRKTHLKRIIELDPDHADARKALGYMRVGERWLTVEEKKKEEGMVLHRGKDGVRWVPAQQLQVIKQREAEEKLQQSWFKKIAQYRSWLDTDRAGAGKREILDIKDKAAERPLLTKLKAEKDDGVRELYAQALMNLGTPAAVNAIVEYSINDNSRNFRVACLELMEKHKPPGATAIYIKGLGDKDNTVVNRAARGLIRLQDQAAVRPLIDALVTRHKFVVNAGGGAGSISPTFSRDSFGNGGSGLSTGGGPKIVYRNLNNEDVRDALVKLTGENYDFSVELWKSWYAESKQQKQPAGNPRRD
jgi:hypothetical protein